MSATATVRQCRHDRERGQRETRVSAAPERTMLTMERLRRLKWLRPFLLALSRRPYNGPDVPSFRYPQPPSLPVPDDVKRALDEQSED